jgi:hypothetical protein
MGRDPLMIWGARSDTIYGLVTMMGRASDAVGKSDGADGLLLRRHDQIIPKNAAVKAAAQLRPGQRSAYYAKGWHLLTRDHQGSGGLERHPGLHPRSGCPLPSNPPPIPRKVPREPKPDASTRVAAGL